MVETIGARAPKIQHYQTVMLESEMAALKAATGCNETKDALAIAAENEIKRAQKRKVVV